jgi:hypothetical protein
MTCLHYASIAYTVVELVNYLSSYDRYSCADASSLLCSLSRIPLPKKDVSATPYLVPPRVAQALELSHTRDLDQTRTCP